MKLLFSIAALTSTTLASTFDTPCGMQCFREWMRDEIKCDGMEEATDDEKLECSNDAFRQFWSGCLGDTCGKTMPDGSCATSCTPPLEEGALACDEQLESGEINQIDHYKCIMSLTAEWERCFAECTCDSPWCNCTPPEIAFKQSGYVSQLHLKDTTITCYPDKL